MPYDMPPAHHAAQRPVSVDQAVFRSLNRARRRYHLPQLRQTTRLVFVATAHSQDLAFHRELSHSSSDGTPFYTRIRKAANARSVGETLISYGGRVSGARIVRAWLRSPPHRAELLSPAYHRVGIGMASARGTSVVTADFAS